MIISPVSKWRLTNYFSRLSTFTVNLRGNSALRERAHFRGAKSDVAAALPRCVVICLFWLTFAISKNSVQAQSTADLLMGTAKIPRVDYTKFDPAELRGRLNAKGNSPAFIGSWANEGEFFDGAIDDLRIYRVALDGDAIAKLNRGEVAVGNNRLTAWFRFDGETKNHALGGQGRNAKPIGGQLGFVEGPVGKALLLNGQNQTLQIDSYRELKPSTNQISISAWIRPSATPDHWMEIYRKEDGSARQLLAIGKTRFYGLWCGFGIDGDYVETGAAIDRKELSNGQWHHVAATYDGSQVRLFHNGAEIRARTIFEEEQKTTTRDDRVRVAFLGNTVIQRAAEYGFLEAELTRLSPRRKIVFRNLGWPGDTVDGAARSEFGPDEKTRLDWSSDRIAPDYGFQKMLAQIKRVHPHILFVFYGSNAAFQDGQGLVRFRTGLAKLLAALKPTGVRIVLVSPPPREIAHEIPRHLAQQNRRLEQVANHLQQVADKRKLDFVNLFRAWPQARGWTDNGIHLNEQGYQQLSRIIATELLKTNEMSKTRWDVHLRADGTVVKSSGTKTSGTKLTQYGMRWTCIDDHLPSVTDGWKNRRLRIDGLQPGTYSLDIDGRRSARGSDKLWAQGVDLNRGPEFEQLAQLRQKIVEKNRLDFYRYRPQNKAYIHLFRRYERGHHAAEVERFALLVAGAEGEVARLSVPKPRIYELVREKDYPDHEVPSERFAASIEDELAAFSIPDGFEINLFAADPMISKPLNINWDERGRMWVSSSAIYPHLQPGQQANDRIFVLEDIDRDGRADKSTVFADDLLVPHSVIPGHGGAYVTQSTDLLFLRDTDGDGKADEKRVLLTGFGNADVHHMIHGLRWGPDGDLYFNQSVYINSVVETPWGVRTSNGSCIWRLRPETLRLDIHAQGLVNPWGHAIDPWGQSFATDGAGGRGLAFMFPGSAYWSHAYNGRELPSMNPGRPNECGLEFLSGRHLPIDWRDSFLTNDFRANRVTRYRLSDKGSGYTSEFLGDMIKSSHRGFRPIDVKMGPDGAIYIVDWYNLIIDHGEVDFHHALRDKQHGRIWRLKAKDSPLLPFPELANASARELLDALTVPEKWTRDQARRLLRERGREVLRELKEWANEESRSEHDRLEALWVCQGMRVVDRQLLERCLISEDHRVRAAAVRVLSDWHATVDDAMEKLQRAVSDADARVRLEAVNALRTVGTRDAVALALHALDQPIDQWLDFALYRTVHQRRDVWLADFQAGKNMFDGQPHRVAFALTAVGGDNSTEPLAELIRNSRLQGKQLVEALVVLASFGNLSQRQIVVDHLNQISGDGDRSVLTALVQSSRSEAPKDLAAVLSLLGANDSQTRLLAMRLCGRWKIKSAVEALSKDARNTQIALELRVAAGEALLAIDREQGMMKMKAIYDSASSESIRATAIAALSHAGLADTIPLAVKLFTSNADAESIAVVTDALLSRRRGPLALVDALKDVEIRSEIADVVIDRARLTGQDVTDLVNAVRRAGRLNPNAKLTVAEIAQIIQDVPTNGDALRGKEIFHRKNMQCVSCHMVNGAGGKVGPDLSSIGTTARIADLLQSLLDPSVSIKQGYDSVQVITAEGQIVSGILLQRTEQQLRIRDAKNKERTIFTEDIDEISSPKVSLMPTGLTDSLGRREVVDLVHYLSSLGRVKEPQPNPNAYEESDISERK